MIQWITENHVGLIAAASVGLLFTVAECAWSAYSDWRFLRDD